MKKLLFVVFLLLFPLTILAQEKPNAAEVRKVMNFYNNSKKGVVLSELLLCRGLYDKGSKKYDCKGLISNNEIMVGDKVRIWMSFFVPKKSKERIVVQYNQNGFTRSASNFKVTGSTRYRRSFSFNAVSLGEWEIKIFHDNGERPKQIGSLKFTVTKKI